MAMTDHNDRITNPEPTLADVLKAVWAARVFVLAGAVAGIVLAFVFLLFTVPNYRVSMLVAPMERAPKADIKALLPDNPSFALQYLVNTIGSQDANDFMRFESMLRGPSVASVLLKDKAIREGIAKSGRFIFSPSPRDDSAAALADILEKQVVIMPVGNTPLRRIAMNHPSPEFGVYLLGRLYTETDRLIRTEIAERADARSAYLKDMLGRVTHPDHRRALTALLMEQEHIQMLLAMEEAFAAIIAEPPSVSVKPAWPRKKLIIPGFAFAGMVLGFAFWGLKRRP